MSYHVQKGTLEAGLKGVHMWYAKEIGKRKEEEVLRDLLIPLLKPLLTPTTVFDNAIPYCIEGVWLALPYLQENRSLDSYVSESSGPWRIVQEVDFSVW